MEILFILVAIGCFIGGPYAIRQLLQRIKSLQIFSDVLLCFGIGILLGNTKNWWLPDDHFQAISISIAENSLVVAVLLAIPILLMTSSLKASLQYTKNLLLSFVLCIVSVGIAVVTVVYCFPDLAYLNKATGCMVGVYVGGTPNMAAISYALQVPESLFFILNATDLFTSGLYFLFLISFAKPLFGLFLRPFQSKMSKEQVHHFVFDHTPFPPSPLSKETVLPLLTVTGLALLCIGTAAGLAFLFPTPEQKPNELVLMIALSSISIGLSFIPRIQGIKGAYELAQYLLLIFAIAVGFMADFAVLLDAGANYLGFNIVFVVTLVLAHLFLAKLFRIDVDTFIITSSACIFGPPFIGQISSAIKNKELLVPGLALGVLGLIIGTFFGIFISNCI